MGIEWLDVALARLRGIEPYEVMQALRAERRWPRPMVGAGGVRALAIWARTRSGRPLIVVLRSLGGLDQQIVGARDMRADEILEFEDWEGDGHG